MKKSIRNTRQIGLFFLLILPFAPEAAARTLTVGSAAAYRTLASASAAALPGDVISILPGTYNQCAIVRTSGITIKAASGRVVLNQTACGGKAALVIAGNNVVVDGLTFNGIRVPDGNGAGIRFEGQNLTVRNSVFSNSQSGILTAKIARGTVTVSGSTFQNLGGCRPSGGCPHAIYANGEGALVVTNSRFLNTKQGHHIKSRVKSTTVTGSTFDDGATGTASYHIDIPNGGNLLVRNNVFIKGANASNRSAIVIIGAEQQTNPTQSLVVTNNQVRSLLTRGLPAFVANRTKVPVILSGNTLTGKVVEVSGPSTAAAASSARSLSAARFNLAPLSFDIAQQDSTEALAGLSLLSDSRGDPLETQEQTRRVEISQRSSSALVSEPSTLAVSGLGLLGLGLIVGRRRFNANQASATG